MRKPLNSRPKCGCKEGAQFFKVGLIAVAVVVIMCVWSQGLRTPGESMHAIATTSHRGYIHGSFYSTPADIVLLGAETKLFEVRIVAGRHAGDGAGNVAGSDVINGFTYSLLTDGKPFFTKSIQPHSGNIGFEDFQSVNLMDLGADKGTEYRLQVNCTSSNGSVCIFAAQVVQMGVLGAWREVVGLSILIVTVISIGMEKIHRVYSAAFGALAAICAVNLIQETVSLDSIFRSIDFGTLTMLFSQMILLHMLQETGFFNWFMAKVFGLAQGGPRRLFCTHCCACGILSMFVDPVTGVMLWGPSTYFLCSRIDFNPRYLYLSMAICASIGSTATLIGQPTNLVFASKLKLNFDTFLMYNFPIIAFVVLPAASLFLYWKLQDRAGFGGELPEIDLDQLQKQNQITDMQDFSKLMGIFFAVLVWFLLAPVHAMHPACFTAIAMFAGAAYFEPHRIHGYLQNVEWDTLTFYALLFCFGESMSQLGVTKMLGKGLKDMIMFFPEGQQTLVAVIVPLWTSAFGSCCCDHMIFAIVMVYVLLDMKLQETEGFNPGVMAWPIGVGLGIGGIGSIMGCGANLVSMAVSARQASHYDEQIHGADFLKHGFPTMVVVIFICMLWQILLFSILGAPAE